MIAAVQEGFDDFVSMPTYPAFVDLFYARSGFAIVSFSSLRNSLHLLSACRGLRAGRAFRRDRTL